MQTTLSEQASQLPRAAEAERILRSCVHCGFCNATCPTYQLLGDELDGPRGRIYLIKQVLEGNEVTRKTQEHLDRCLSCRNCETTCPSGVEYHNLLDIGRAVVDAAVQRPLAQRLLRQGLRKLVPNPGLFKGLIGG
ncbi:4Fe-4S dicluster domain-containing protein, partial [Pseudomonas gingeri]